MTVKNYIFSSLLMASLLAGQKSFAEGYKISLHAPPASNEAYQTSCTSRRGICQAFIDFPMNVNSRTLEIHSVILIENGHVNAAFKLDNQYLSITGQGWQAFSENLEVFSHNAQVVRLYKPHPSIKADMAAPALAVIRPANAPLGEIAIDILPQQ